MPLNEMTLQTMARLADDIDAVRAAMAILAHRGIVAHADLTPGTPMMITLVREMPALRYGFEDAPVPGEIAVTYNGAPVQDHDPDKYARAAGLVDNEGFEVEPEPTPITAEAPPAADTGESAEGAVVAAPEPAVIGPGEAAAPPVAPGPTMPPAWSEEDVDRLIQAVAAGMEIEDLSLRAAALRVAPALGRPGDGTYMKARSLIERIEARRRDMARALAANKIPAGPPAGQGDETAASAADAALPGEGPEVAEGATLPDDAAAAGVAGPAVPLTPFGEMCQYLASLPRKRGWTVQRDHDVLHFADLGWKPAEIALELGIPADELKPRFAMLTRTGSYKRAEVLQALKERLAAAGTAAAA